MRLITNTQPCEVPFDKEERREMESLKDKVVVVTGGGSGMLSKSSSHYTSVLKHDHKGLGGQRASSLPNMAPRLYYLISTLKKLNKQLS